MQTSLKTAFFSTIKAAPTSKMLLLACFSYLANGTISGSANAQAQVVEFSRTNCNLIDVAIPQNATIDFYNRTYGLRLKPNVGTHRWKAGSSAIRVSGECQSHIIWGIGSLIGLDSHQYAEFENRNQASSFHPSPYRHTERFSNFDNVPKLRGYKPVYFAALTSPPMGVWRSASLWAINFVTYSQNPQRTFITKIATSTRKIVSAIPEGFYHSQDYKLGIVQEQMDGSRIAFTFVYEKKD